MGLRDALWLGAALLLLIATGIGLRDPWPADEPRFALVARDMVLSGDWLFPRIGGDLYHDKPPLYFWLLSVAYLITGSVRASFLIPSFLAAAGTLALVYDLARRLAGRAAASASALLLVFSLQFVLVTRGAQIDATLCFLTTLSFYAFARHLLLGPAWGWYFIGGLSAGLGVITKGVGFLPILVLLPYFFLRARGFQPLPRFPGGARWMLAILGLLLGIGLWLVPMLLSVAQSADAQLAHYRDAILFQQTVKRYTAAWHHIAPWYFFIGEVVPTLWLPGSLLLVWLVPRWKQAWTAREARVWLPLAWVLLVLIFFSASPGKRGIYIFPALPVFVVAAAAFLPELFRRRGVRIASVALGGILVAGAIALAVLEALGRNPLQAQLTEAGLDARPVYLLAGSCVIFWLVAAWRRPLFAWPAVLVALALVWSWSITPKIDAQRSGRAFTESVLAKAPRGRELAWLAPKEQFLLYLDRPVTNFGHGRWVEGQAEVYDAARWLNAAPGRMLVVPQSLLNPCFNSAPRFAVGSSAGVSWSLISLPATLDCAARGDITHAIRYVPPRSRTGS